MGSTGSRPSDDRGISYAKEEEPFRTVDELVASRELQLGDPIEFEDKVLRHWAIYAGEEAPDGEVVAVPVVVHFFSVNGCPHEVRYDSLETASCGKRCRVNRKYDLRFEPRDPVAIMKTAYKKVGQTDYSILSNNCEHFVTLCRNGQGMSEQVDEAKASHLKKMEIAAAAISSGFSTATYSFKGLFSKS